MHHLAGAEPKTRLAALRALAVCWNSAARRPVIDRLADKDQAVRNAAADLVRVNVSRRQLCELLPRLIEEKNFDLAVPVFELAEQHTPDLARMKEVLARPEFHKVMDRYLPRYYSPELTAETLKLLEGAEAAVRRAGIIALVHQNAAAPEVRARLAGLLADGDADVREAAGEYLLWHGSQAELPALAKAAAAEKDPYALAALGAAAEGIARRDKARIVTGLRGGTEPTEGASPPAAADYRQALLLLRANPCALTLRGALAFYRSQDALEPILRYAGQDAEREALRRAPYRLKLAAELFGFPGKPDLDDGERPALAPVARTFMPPVRDYFDPQRQSFGVQIKPGTTTFANSAHVGDDVAWLKDQRTVVAIGDGVVRRIRCSYTWGHLLVVEHQLADGRWCCSLYAHLSPAICVRPGDVVRKGQKLGSVGRSHTWENGGYWAHLHFGIHEGGYDGGGWICGYIGRESWKAGDHGWADPQKFIRERLEEQKPEAAAGPARAG